MDWKDIGSAVSKVAPVLSGVLTATGIGAPVAAVVSAAGGMLASFLGVEATPEAVGAAIQDPATLIKVRELEIQQQDRLLTYQERVLEYEAKGLTEVNATMRAEAASEHWPQWSWRPFWGFASGVAFLAVSVLCCWLGFDAVKARDMVAIGMIPQLVASFATLFAIPGAILGVASWQRGKEKIEAVKAGAGCK